MALLLLALLAVTTAALRAAALGDGTGPTDVPYVEAFLGRKPPEPQQWNTFLRENLEPDLAPWRARAPLRTAEVVRQFEAFKEFYKGPAALQLVLIYNNTVYWLDRPDPNGPEPDMTWASMYIVKLHRKLTAALQSGRVQLPNCLFIYVTDDNVFRFGDPRRNQTAPHFALMKAVGVPGGGADLDILLPQMRDVSDSLHMVPWPLKTDLAFFRGVPTCTGKWIERYGYLDSCSRVVLSYYTDRDTKAGNGTVLDVAITEPFQYRAAENSSVAYLPPVKPAVPIPQWSRYKWLLNLEGVVAAYRLSQLMTVNSLVLFQRVPYIEYFYRSIQPWQHYVPFWNATGTDGQLRGMDDVYDVVRELRRLDAQEPAKIQQIIANAQTFAARFLTNHMRIAYYKAALEQYKSLFPDMDAYIAQTLLPELGAKGWRI
ncbi:hypothetical protein HYH02_014866 [Chlamydomonas schloesseri]|uniref:Glycosyl transferase CAP10 domain-containing protein n=1 Tax=Chlamydomonas schloesseri TaxID=2026947 RepID=A0A835SUK4_9CHLO|nr:hypothetical protein HYH02_014866 [Chlamydomonas schloesseri]|eukprot:KAG2426111.1 hypothetical protein HYH02_014866 [Chlamydomonas schloesseri]